MRSRFSQESKWPRVGKRLFGLQVAPRAVAFCQIACAVEVKCDGFLSYTESQIDVIPQMWSADEQHALSCSWADSGIQRTSWKQTGNQLSGRGISTSDVVNSLKVLLALHGVMMPRFGRDAEKYEPGQNQEVDQGFLELQTTSGPQGKI